MAKAKRKPVGKKKAPKKAGPKKKSPKPKPRKSLSRIVSRQKPKMKKAPKPRLTKKAKPVKKALAKKPAPKKAKTPRPAPKMELIKESPKVEMIPPAPAVLLLAAPKEEKPPAPAPKEAPAPKPAPPEETKKPIQPPAQARPQPIEPIPPKPAEIPKPLPPIEPIEPAAKEEKPKEALEPEARPLPPAPKPEQPRPQAGGIRAILPALEQLPDWEDRLRLRRVIFEDGLQFFMMGKGTSEFDEAYLLLNQTHKLPHSDLDDYFLICAKDRSGRVIAAIDGHALSDELLVIGRSFSGNAKRREMHALLYAAALSGRKPSFVACYTKLGDFSVETAGRLIFFGRGFGMSALPLKTSHLIFVRRMHKELNPLSSGAEIAGILEKLKVFGELELDAHIDEFKQKASVALVPLPSSPDSREHLHELKDVVNALGLGADQLYAVMASLRADYVSGRKDITPDAL